VNDCKSNEILLLGLVSEVFPKTKYEGKNKTLRLDRNDNIFKMYFVLLSKMLKEFDKIVFRDTMNLIRNDELLIKMNILILFMLFGS
jgi:hypothetical protein